MKRRSDANDQIDALEAKKPKRNIQFTDVAVYYFPRIQGFTCVPSQGGCTLGMGAVHIDEKLFTLNEHIAEQKRIHRQQMLERSPRPPSVLSTNSMHALLPNPALLATNQLSVHTSSTINPTLSASTAAAAAAAINTSLVAAPDDRSSTDESDSEEDIFSDNSGSEVDTETIGFLQPVSQRQRRALLKSAGVREILASEKNECRDIRASREFCGCNCRDYCDPETCLCSQSGIKCQVSFRFSVGIAFKIQQNRHFNEHFRCVLGGSSKFSVRLHTGRLWECAWTTGIQSETCEKTLYTHDYATENDGTRKKAKEIRQTEFPAHVRWPTATA